MEMKIYDKALMFHTQAIELDPENAEYLFQKGKCLTYLKRFNEAIKYFRNDCKNLEIHGLKGMCLYELNDCNAAVVEFNKALKFEPLNKQYSYLRYKSIWFKYKNELFLFFCVLVIFVSILIKKIGLMSFI